MNKLYSLTFRLLKLSLIYILLIAVSFNVSLSVSAEGISDDELIEGINEIINGSEGVDEEDSIVDEELNGDDESGVTDEVAQSTVTVNFRQLVPYAQFINYQYHGDGTLFDVQDIIMEYAPDGNGIFQVAAYSGNSAVAHVYQIRDSGFYELASFNDYYVVEDLRYSPEAMDGNESLILPSDLTIGSSYSSGYNNETVRTIAEQISSFSIGDNVYNDVVRLVEHSQDATGPVTYNYYLAPNYGIIVIESINSEGVSQRIMQLVSVNGYLN